MPLLTAGLLRSGVLLLAGWLICSPARAATAVEVEGDFGETSLRTSLQLLEDPSGRRSFAEVRNDANFAPIGAKGSNFGFSRSAWWARLDLHNGGARDIEVELRQDYPLIDRLDVWIGEGTQWHEIHTGDRLPFRSRPLAHRDFIFPVQVASRTTTTVYVRFQTAGAMNIGLRLYSPHRLLEQISLEQLGYGFYFGGFGVLFFYNLFIYFAVRDRAILYYLLYAASYGLYFGVHDGLSFQFLWPNSPVWGNQALIVLLCLTLNFGLQFARHFLNSMLLTPRLDSFAQALRALALTGLAASFVAPYALLIQPLALTTTVSVLLMMAMGVVGLARGYQPARFFMVAWFALLVGVLAYMLKTFGLLPHNALTQNGFQAGALIEMVLLSLALAARVNDLQRQTLTDALTGLNNRRFFDRELELVYGPSHEMPVGLLVIDIDLFKLINDRYGHTRGDEVLIEVGRLLRDTVPPGATVCRYGGEEFSVILPGCELADAKAVADSLRTAVESRFSTEPKITISIGVASTAGRQFANASDFFRSADTALYEAKAQGRNRVAMAAA